MSRLVLVALLALCVLTQALANKDTRESMEDSEKPPQEFPKEKALNFDVNKLPTPKTSLEVSDLTKNNDTEPVNHPNVNDPGKTHEEGTESSRGSIHACALPNIQDRDSSASNWLADTGNVTKVCHLPLKSLDGAQANVRVCSIPRDAWNSSYTVVDGTISKELLADLNTSSVKCVTPSEALSNNSTIAEDDSIANGSLPSSLPSAWLRSNDTIYIYIIPQEWLRKTQPEKATEADDLNKEFVDTTSSSPNPNSSTSAPTAVVANSSATSSLDSTATTSPSSIDASNSTEVRNVSEPSKSPTINSTMTSSPSNNTDTSVSTSSIESTESSVSTVSSTAASEVIPGVSAKTTEKPKDVKSKPTESPKEESSTKATETPKQVPTKTTEKTKEEVTKTTENPVVVVTKKPKENITKKPNEETTEKHKYVVTPGEHSEKDNEIGHRVPSPQPPEALSQQHSEHNHSNTGKTAFLQPTESAAILAGVFVAIALLGYAGLLLWRRVLEKRYGNREMLVNEDDDFDTSDMRHFEL